MIECDDEVEEVDFSTPAHRKGHLNVHSFLTQRRERRLCVLHKYEDEINEEDEASALALAALQRLGFFVFHLTLESKEQEMKGVPASSEKGQKQKQRKDTPTLAGDLDLFYYLQENFVDVSISTSALKTATAPFVLCTSPSKIMMSWAAPSSSSSPLRAMFASFRTNNHNHKASGSGSKPSLLNILEHLEDEIVCESMFATIKSTPVTGGSRSKDSVCGECPKLPSFLRDTTTSNMGNTHPFTRVQDDAADNSNGSSRSEMRLSERCKIS